MTVAACTPVSLLNTLSPSSHYKLTADLAYGSLDRQTLNVYIPRSLAGPAPLIVFFYGGGWREGKKKNYEFVASALTEAGYVVVIPDYRLHPQVVFPSFVEDAAQAVSWSLQHATELGADAEKLFIMGHSAGAHIGALLSMDPRYLGNHSIGIAAVRGFVGLSGPYNFLPIKSGYLLNVFPPDIRELSQPINFATSDVPPTLLIHGIEDDVVKPANSESLARKLSQQGVDVTLKLYKDTGHADIAAALAPPLDFTNSTLEDTRKFLDAQSERVERNTRQSQMDARPF